MNDTSNAEGASTSVLQVDSARVQFEKLRAVDDVSFTLRGGDLLGLIGPNGAGKTTLLRALAGLQSLSRGLIRVLDQRLDPSDGSIMRHVGFASDTPPVYEELEVREFLQFIGRGYDLTASEIRERSDFWLEKVWLTEKATTQIKQLSRGMRQRVGIARTLLPNPSMILLDEPAAGLDPAGRVQFRQLLVNLREQGKALIVSSHILADMDEYCTHIGIMSAGRLVQFGTVAQIATSADNHRSRYTMLLASPVTQLEQQLASIEGLTSIQVDRERVIFEYHATRDRAAELLRELMKRGLPIASFTENASGLEEAYLRTGIRQVD